MKSFDSRTYSILDFVNWEKRGELALNPAFQRRAVWSDTAKSFLMDTIIRGKPIPKIFIRVEINVSTKSATHDVVDGQQRLRTILSYIKDGFYIKRSQNKEFGGKLFSQLPPEAQAQILSYELAVDHLINLPNSEVLDIFSRLNSYAIILNEQERINANHFGPFKTLADEIGRKYNKYWTTQGILTSKDIFRMSEVNLVADLLIALTAGIKPKKQIKKFYDNYENKFDFDVDELESLFDAVVDKIAEIFPAGLGTTEFKRPVLYYSLFTAVAHALLSLPGLDAPQPSLGLVILPAINSNLERVGLIFEKNGVGEGFSDRERQFLRDCQRATTDEPVRKRRTMFLLDLMSTR